jgi:hypothetical protein
MGPEPQVCPDPQRRGEERRVGARRGPPRGEPSRRRGRTLEGAAGHIVAVPMNAAAADCASEIVGSPPPDPASSPSPREDWSSRRRLSDSEHAVASCTPSKSGAYDGGERGLSDQEVLACLYRELGELPGGLEMEVHYKAAGRVRWRGIRARGGRKCKAGGCSRDGGAGTEGDVRAPA